MEQNDKKEKEKDGKTSKYNLDKTGYAPGDSARGLPRVDLRQQKDYIA